MTPQLPMIGEKHCGASFKPKMAASWGSFKTSGIGVVPQETTHPQKFESSE